MTKIYNKMAIKNETLKYYFFQWQWTLSLLRRFFPFLYHRQDFYLTCLWERWRGVLSETGTPYLWERSRGVLSETGTPYPLWAPVARLFSFVCCVFCFVCLCSVSCALFCPYLWIVHSFFIAGLLFFPLTFISKANDIFEV